MGLEGLEYWERASSMRNRSSWEKTWPLDVIYFCMWDTQY